MYISLMVAAGSPGFFAGGETATGPRAQSIAQWSRPELRPELLMAGVLSNITAMLVAEPVRLSGVHV
eukprot:COSAG05_NODE_1224_length_5470_cov_4.161140_4_plen_67_part_00